MNRLLLRFFRWYCHPDYLEDLEGDLHERFERNFNRLGKQKANWLLLSDVISLFRPGLIKPIKINYPIINFEMIRHTLILIFRNFKRFKSTFFINLIGLSTGLACALLIYLWIHDELQFDKMHEKDDRLYQVMQNFPEGDEIETETATPGLLAAALAEEFPEIEAATTVASPLWGMEAKGILTLEDTYFKANGLYVDQNYFDVFSFPLIQGSNNQVLSDKHAVLISDEMALKVFGTTEGIIGKNIEWNQRRMIGKYTISGVFEKPPVYSSLQFDLLFSYDLMFSRYKRLHKWGNSDPSTYIVLKKGTDLAQFNAKIKDFIKAKHQSLNENQNYDYDGTLFLQKYSDRYLNGQYENGKVAGGRIAYVRLFSIIALFLLIIACINFMNLSTAKASRRLKEVGVKKVIGASRKTLIWQYLGESLLMTILSLCLALVMVSLFLPQFNIITGKALRLRFDPQVLFAIAAISLFTGIVAGSYPALYLSGFSPALILKGKINTSVGEVWARKGLVVFQFTVSVILIVSVLVVYKQINFINTKNLGYDKDNVLTFANEGKLESGLETFLEEVKKMPGVIAASSFGHDLTGNHGGTTGLYWDGKQEGDRVEFGNLEVDYGLIDMLGFEMKEGRTFSKAYGADTTKIIFNEAAIQAMGLKNPIGKTVKLWGEERQIIGVAKNFHFASLYETVGPCFFLCYPNLDNILVKIKAGMEQETITQLQQFYQSFNNGLAFEYRFLDEDYQTLYASERRVGILSRFFAGIAILISCLGLFGLAAFTAERRLKEIGIRKILGASNLGIIRLLSGDFTRMVFIAILIALPISYMISKSWLDNFAYRIDLKVWFFLAAGLLTIVIAWFTVGMQTFRAANVNPIQCLKEE